MIKQRPRIWIDLENTPHVPFFLPIIHELQIEGCDVLLTARDFAQTVELAERAGLTVTVVGKGGGSGTLRKSAAILSRALRLARIMRGQHIDLAVGHGSRGLLLASSLLGIRSLTLYDYEGASVKIFNRLSSHIMTPAMLDAAHLIKLGLDPSKHLTYPGLKEEVYLHRFQPSSTLPVRLGLERTNINVVVRPPSDTAHYRTSSSHALFREVMSLLACRQEVHVVLLPRDAEQREAMMLEYAPVRNVTIPDRAVDGASLLYYSDLVIGGGGTMNREAAVLGVPVLSIFKGSEGAVDRNLKQLGKLIDISAAEDIVPFLRQRDRHVPDVTDEVKTAIVRSILALAVSR